MTVNHAQVVVQSTTQGQQPSSWYQLMSSVSCDNTVNGTFFVSALHVTHHSRYSPCYVLNLRNI